MSTTASNTPPKTPIHYGGIFAALRRMNGVMNATKEELDAIVSSGEGLAGWCVLLIVAALVAEAILVFIPLAPLLAKIDLFIVNSLIAVGVFGELFFHRRSSHAQSELQRRTDDKLADALRRAERLENRLDRRIRGDGPPGRRNVAKGFLGQLPRQEVNVISYPGDLEAEKLAEHIGAILSFIGWDVSFPKGGKYELTPIFDISVEAKGTFDAAHAIVKWLQDSRIPASCRKLEAGHGTVAGELELNPSATMNIVVGKRQ